MLILNKKNKKFGKKFSKIKQPIFKPKFSLPTGCNDIFLFGLKIIIKKNNVFCIFSDAKNYQTIKSCSSEVYKIKVSKKTLRYTYRLILAKFYAGIRKKIYGRSLFLKWRIRLQKKKKDKRILIKKLKALKALKLLKALKKNKKKPAKVRSVKGRKGMIVCIIASKRLRRKIFKNLRWNFREIPLILIIANKKIYNGCRPPKAIRKKRQRLRLFKNPV